MNLNEISDFLEGRKFSNGLQVTISNPEKEIISRFSFLKRISNNKRVIHLGCCDHIELINEKIKKKQYMHEILTNSAKKCIGIDINKDGINFMKSSSNYNNVLCADIINDDIPILKKEKWDYLIMGEIIEHVDNPVLFLKKIKDKYKNCIDKVIITAPNAFSYLNFQSIFKYKEIINSDHKYWFTPYTLAKVATNAGFKTENFYFAHSISKNIGGRKAKLLVYPFIKQRLKYNKLLKYPGLRNTLIMIMRF